MTLKPEEEAREKIDDLLVKAGWIIQDYKAFNCGAGLGLAIREVPTTTGPADYILFVDRKAVGVIEAKKEGKILSGVEEQSARYATGFPDECHRSIYNLWRQVLEYFDCSLIGLTATPSAQTMGFFNKNLVMDYSHLDDEMTYEGKELDRAVVSKVNG